MHVSTTEPERPGRLPGAGEDRWPLSHRPEATAQARDITRTVLRDWKVGGAPAEEALHVVSGLVEAAVLHSRAPVELHLYRTRADGSLWIGVSDGGPVPGTADGTGPGPAPVAAPAVASGTRRHRGGSTRWARVRAA